MAKRLPWIKFYPKDWLSDGALRSCPAAARGVWIDLVCLMATADKYGVMVTNGKIWTVEDVAKVCGVKSRTVRLLGANGVLSTSARCGILFSPRMVRDRLYRQRQARFAKKNPIGSGQAPYQASPRPRVRARQKSEVRSQSTTETTNVVSSTTPRKARPRDPIWDTLCRVYHHDPKTKSEQKAIGGLVRDLKAKGATADEIRVRAARWRMMHPEDKFNTSRALVAHWDELATEPSNGTANAQSRIVHRDDSHYENAGQLRDKFR